MREPGVNHEGPEENNQEKLNGEGGRIRDSEGRET
jgi:hypothetical protein